MSYAALYANRTAATVLPPASIPASLG